MIRSYIGIVGQRGLEAWYPENDDTVRHLIHWLPPRLLGGLVWAAIDDEAADYVEEQIADGETTTALRTVEEYAMHCGSIQSRL